MKAQLVWQFPQLDHGGSVVYKPHSSNLYSTLFTVVSLHLSPLTAMAGEVHYEAIDARGTFTHHEIMSDPRAKGYRRGLWSASLNSTVIPIGNPTARNRVNIVYVGDGYSRSEMNRYDTDVRMAVAQLLAHQPFRSYVNYFNFHEVQVISAESGVSQDPQGRTRRTALGMGFFCNGIDRLLCANVDAVMAEARNAGSVDMVFALANSSTYGGAGYWSPPIATFSARNADAVELALHEFGHSFGGLGDEYTTAGGAVENCARFPNVGSQTETTMRSSRTKWYRWLDIVNVGAFLGSCYSTRNFYRPTASSKMHTLGMPFDVVNEEQFILQIYKRVRPIEMATPAGSYRGHRILQVVPMAPNHHRLELRWTLDGVLLSKYDGVEKLDTSQLGLRRGAHSIVAMVADNTPAVRDEIARARDMTQRVAWTINVMDN